MHQKEGDENRRDSHRTKPLVTHETRWMKRETFHREFVVKLLDQRLPLGPLQLEPELANLLFQQFILAQVDPIGGFHLTQRITPKIPFSSRRVGERSRLGCTGRRPADRTVCSASVPSTAREARALPL